MYDPFRGGAPFIKLDGAELDDDIAADLNDVRVEQSLHLPDTFDLRFYDHDFRTFDKKLFEIGKEVEVSFKAGEATAAVTRGEIIAVAVEPGPNGAHELVVSGMDESHRLQRGAKVRTWQEVTDTKTIEDVAREASLAKDVRWTGPPIEHEYMMQHESDAAFISERAHAVGSGWWYADGKLRFGPQKASGTPIVLEWGDDLLKFTVRLSASETVATAEVRGWDPTTQKSITGTYSAKKSADELGSSAPAASEAATRANGFDGARLGVAAPVLDTNEANRLAQSVVERGAAEQIVARGETLGNPKLRPGIDVEMKNVGTRLSGKYLLTSVVHVWGGGRPYVTRFESGGRRPADLVGLLQSDSGHNRLGDKMLIGLVTGLEDPEDLGRVRVKFPAVSDDDEGAWARLLMPGAGPDRGLVVYPEINDEVLVAFEHGDLRRPVILGGLWSEPHRSPELGNDREPALTNGVVDNRGWKTQSGHSLKFTDKGGSEEIALTHMDTTALVLGSNDVSLDSRQPVKFTGDDTYDADFKGNITVKGQEITIEAVSKLVLKAPTIEITATGNVEVKGAQAKLEGSAMVEVKGAAATIQGSGITEIKGGLVKIN
jgi:uncharacterized protein involved in type VI secretion and phage assembly